MRRPCHTWCHFAVAHVHAPSSTPRRIRRPRPRSRPDAGTRAHAHARAHARAPCSRDYAGTTGTTYGLAGIHSRVKRQVGERLAQAGISSIYGQTVGCISPVLESCVTVGNTDGEDDGDINGDGDDSGASGGVVVTFANVDWEHGHELVVYGEEGFEFQYNGSEEWWSARISKVDGKGEVTVVAADPESGGSSVDEPPSAIRYAWRDNPCCTSGDFEASDCPIAPTDRSVIKCRNLTGRLPTTFIHSPQLLLAFELSRKTRCSTSPLSTTFNFFRLLITRPSSSQPPPMHTVPSPESGQ